MRKKPLIKGGIRLKITAAIVTCSIVVASLVGGISIAKSRNIVEEQSKESLLLTTENKAKEFNITILDVESSVEDLATTLSSSFKLEENKKDKNYINNYEQSIQDVVKKFGETTQGDMSVYFYVNPELTGGVHGAWYADKKNNKTFEAQPLGSIDQFDPNNKDMNWYYRPVNAHKAVWLAPYVDPDLKITMISYVTPIYQDNTLIGVIGMDIDFNYFKKVVSETKVYETGYAILLSENNDVLVHPSLKLGDNIAKVEDGALKSVTDTISKNKSGVIDYLYNGSKKTLAYSHLSNGFILLLNAPQNEVLAKVHNLTVMAIALIVLGVIISVVVAKLISKRLANPIIQATNIIDKTAKFDLIYDKTLEPLLKNQDETGMMVRSIGNMRNLLRNIVKELTQDASATSECTHVLTTATNEASESINNISKATEELAQAASEQAAITQDGLMKLLDLSNELDVVISSSSFVKETLDETNKLSKNIKFSVENLKQQFELNNGISQEITTNIDLLANKSDSIGKIINTIKYIAGQTNLLALNAAIEAARAGEHGKGFAVVADQIKKLSEQTSLSTKDIEKIISEIQLDIGNAKNKIDSSKVIVTESDKALYSTSHAFEEINEAIKNSSSQTSELITSIQKISESKNEVVSIIQEISSIIEETAASTEEVSSSLENQTSTINSIFDTSDKLKNLVTKLDDIVKEFKI